MFRWGMVAVTAIVVAAALIPTGAAPTGGGVRHRVDIQRFTFMPERLVVAVGDTVVWVNRDLVPHALAAQDGSWGSSSLETNITWELRVTEETSGAYFCPYHPTMRGQVQVRRKERTHGHVGRHLDLEEGRRQ